MNSTWAQPMSLYPFEGKSLVIALLSYAQDPREYTIFLILFLAPFILTYATTRASWELSVSSKQARRVPSSIPYSIPFLGNVVQLLLKPLSFIHDSTWSLKTPNPFSIKILSRRVYVIQGAENISALWKASYQMSGMTAQIFCLGYLFGMPRNALQMYTDDHSGFLNKPHELSNTLPEDRVDYRTHVSLLRFMNGGRLAGFYSRWTKLWLQKLTSLNIGNEWVEMHDLLAFFETHFASTVVEAACGPILEAINPQFTQDLAHYQRRSGRLSKGLPQWLIPGSYAIRNKLLSNIRQWHAVASRCFQTSSVDSDGDFDPYWGSEFMRTRRDLFNTFKGFDLDAAAASDLGFIWALTFNIVPTSMWVNFEIHREISLRSKIRAELDSLEKRVSDDGFDVQNLLSLPRIQSVYAEALRLRTHVIVPRESSHADVDVGRWICPKKSTIVAASHPAHMDNTAWNTGENGSHPVEEFWAERFLTSDPQNVSGPMKKTEGALKLGKGSLESTGSIPTKSLAAQPSFEISSTAGHWFPYGGGPRICPGRHFAKRAILTVTASMIDMFEIEILDSSPAVQLDFEGYGLGVQRPVGKIPFRIRQRPA